MKMIKIKYKYRYKNFIGSPRGISISISEIIKTIIEFPITKRTFFDKFNKISNISNCINLFIRSEIFSSSVMDFSVTKFIINENIN